MFPTSVNAVHHCGTAIHESLQLKTTNYRPPCQHTYQLPFHSSASSLSWSTAFLILSRRCLSGATAAASGWAWQLVYFAGRGNGFWIRMSSNKDVCRSIFSGNTVVGPPIPSILDPSDLIDRAASDRESWTRLVKSVFTEQASSSLAPDIEDSG